jgi:hypothetical protein
MRFLARAFGVGLGLAALGYLPTRHLAGSAGVIAMLAGCAVAWIASGVGGLPLALGSRPTAGAFLGGPRGLPGRLAPAPTASPTAILLAMALRLGTVVALGIAAAESGLFEVRSLVLWTAIGYVAQLVVDSHYAITTAGSGGATAPVPGKEEVESE